MSACPPSEPDELLAVINSIVHPLHSESCSLAAALHRVLTVNALSDSDHPPFDRSEVDGYAILASDDSTSFNIISQIKAGDTPSIAINKGETIRVLTGAAIPEQELRIIKQEDVKILDNQISIREHSTHDYIRRKGSDLKTGDAVINAPRRLTSTDISILAFLGITNPSVTKLPKISHWITGDEIVPAEAPPAIGKIRDSNGPLIQSLIRAMSLPSPNSVYLGDSYPKYLKQFENELRNQTDLLLISGGSGKGDYDYTQRFLAESGFTIHTEQINIRPGKPLIFASRDRQYAFGLPGNPLSHYVCFHLFVKFAINKLLGLTASPETVTATLTHTLSNTSGKTTLWPCRLELENARLHATPLKWNNSGNLTALHQANGLMMLQSNTCSYSEGTHINVLITEPII